MDGWTMGVEKREECTVSISRHACARCEEEEEEDEEDDGGEIVLRQSITLWIDLETERTEGNT